MDDERYISVEMSIIGSLLEVREMRAGRLPEKTWQEFLKELRAEDEQEKNSKEVINMENQDNYERYIPVEMSIVGSLLEIREMRAGRLPEKTWQEVRAEIEAEIAAEERAELNEHHSNKVF